MSFSRLIGNLAPYIAMGAMLENMDSRGTALGTFDNTQYIVAKHCKQCGKEFNTKAQGGYTKCKQCNG